VNATLQALLSLREFVSDLADVFHLLEAERSTATTLKAARGLAEFVAMSTARVNADADSKLMESLVKLVAPPLPLEKRYRRR
jgi:hypothetical protein